MTVGGRRALRLWPRSVAAQLALLLVAALLAAQVVALLVVSGERRALALIAFHRDLAGRTASVVRLLEETPPPLEREVLSAASTPVTRFRITRSPAVSPPETRLERRIARLVSEAVSGENRPVAVTVTRQRSGAVRRDRDGRAGRDRGDRGRPLRRRFGAAAIALAVPLADGSHLAVEARRPALPSRLFAPLLPLVLAGTAIVLVASLFVRRITRPLRQIADASARIGRGERVPRLPETGPSEVRAATAAFNAMQTRIDRFLSDRTRMLAAVSHDLRTPLTTLRLRAEFVDDEALRAKMIETIDEMGAMTEAALAFARDEAEAEETRPVDLAALVGAIADDAREAGGEVDVTTPDRLVHPCRSSAVRRAIRNLVENALRYAGSARVRLEATAEGPRITVSDDGPGIAPDQLEAVFEPFFRVEASRSRETGGVGMGLAIARSTARAHGGDVALVNRPGGGLDAVLTLAAADAPRS